MKICSLGKSNPGLPVYWEPTYHSVRQPIKCITQELINISGSTIVEDEHGNYYSEFAAEDTLLEAPETNADESSLGKGKRVKQLNSKYVGAFWKVHLRPV